MACRGLAQAAVFVGGGAAFLFSAGASAWTMEDHARMLSQGTRPQQYWTSELGLGLTEAKDERGLAFAMESRSGRASLEHLLELDSVPLLEGEAKLTRVHFGGGFGYSPAPHHLHWAPLEAGVRMEMYSDPVVLELDGESVTLSETDIGYWVGTSLRYRFGSNTRATASLRTVDMGDRSGMILRAGVEQDIFLQKVALRLSGERVDEELEVDDRIGLSVRYRFR